MLKKAKVVMLPTNEKAPIILGKRNKLYLDKDIPNITYNRILNPTTWIYQHLYIISDDEIKEDDWFYNSQTNRVIKAKVNEYHYLSKKIIATTDSSLTIESNMNINSIPTQYVEEDKLLPQPSQSFIEKYVEKYNKGNIITNVLVEYDVITLNEDWSKNPVVVTNEYKLKISKDNTITINKVKDSWSREEIEKLIYQYSSEVYGIKSKPALTIKWIEENL